MSDLPESVDAAFAHLAAAMTHDQRREAERGVLAAYRSALAGETEQDVVARSVDAVCDELGYGPTGRQEILSIVKATSLILRAPLLLQLQDKEARVKALEAALEAHAGCLATDRCPACSAIPEAR